MSFTAWLWVVLGAPSALQGRQEKGWSAASLWHCCVDLSPNNNPPPLPPPTTENFHGHVFMMFHLLMPLNGEHQDEKDITLSPGRGYSVLSAL